MIQYPEMKIQLNSHTDSQGKDKYNQELSQRRAASAKRWLIKNGINVTRRVCDPRRSYDYPSEEETIYQEELVPI